MKDIVRTICQGCHSECGVLVQRDQGRVKKIKPDPRHPSSRGYICIKGINYAELNYHPDRLKYPLRRKGPKASGRWERISWDQALDEIAIKLTKVKEEYGAHSIGAFHGTAPRQSLFSCNLLASAIGTPNVASTDLHICYAPSMVAELATFGCPVLQEEGPDYVFSKCIFVCGANPLISHPPRGRDLLEGIKNNGAKLIVVDPRRTELASRADIWLQIRPGTDAALVLAMLNIIITEELYDTTFVDQCCHGFRELRESIQDYTPEKVGHLTWLSAAMIREAAYMFARSHPATVHHRVAVEHNHNSTQTDRALAILAAITGNLGVKGGNLMPTHLAEYISTSGVIGGCKLAPELAKERIGYDQYPLISGSDPLFLFVHAALIAKAMLEGTPYPLRALFLAGGNPVVNMQNTRRTWEAFKSLDLLVVAEFFMTPSAELADYVLPATTWLERDECCDAQYMNCVAARQKSIDPVGESRDDIQMVIDLVKRLHWADRNYIPWDSTAQFNDSRVRGMGMTFEEFKEKGYITIDQKYRQYEKNGFNTPTGKVELYSTIFEKYGYPPLPYYEEPPESPVKTPELLEDYPYILITGGRTLEYYHSSGRQITSLRDRMPDPLIEINPETAKRENIKEGDWVWIETPQIKGERARFRVKVTSDLEPRVVHAQHGWWFPEKSSPDHGLFESNISIVLSDDPPREKVCGSVATRGTLCRIYS